MNILWVVLIMLAPVLAHAEGFNWGELFSPGGAGAVIIVLGLEAMAGATNWFKSGSMLELGYKMVLKLFKKETVL